MNKKFAAAVLHYFAMATSRVSSGIKGGYTTTRCTVHTHESILYIIVLSTDVAEAETS